MSSLSFSSAALSSDAPAPTSVAAAARTMAPDSLPPSFGDHPPAIHAPSLVAAGRRIGGVFSPRDPHGGCHVMNGVANDHPMDSAGGGEMYSRHSLPSREGRPRHGHIAHNEIHSHLHAALARNGHHRSRSHDSHSSNHHLSAPPPGPDHHDLHRQYYSSQSQDNSSHCSQSPSLLTMHDLDLLTLDMRSYRKLEDAIVRVKYFLENVRHLATKRGLNMEGEVEDDSNSRTQPSLYVTIVTGESGNGSPGTILRTVLQEIFRHRDIHFIDHGDGGESFQVDALSGIQDPYEDQPPSKISHDETTASRNHHPFPNNEHHNSLDDNNEPALASRHQAMMVKQAELLHQHSTYRSSTRHKQPQPPHQPQMAHSYPQDHGAGMLYNPFDSIAHSSLRRHSNPNYNPLSDAPSALGRVDRSGRRKTGLPTAAHQLSPLSPSSPNQRLSDPGLLGHNGNSGVAAALLGTTTHMSSTEPSLLVAHNGGGNNLSYPTDQRHRQQHHQQKHALPPSSLSVPPEEAVLRALAFAQGAQSSSSNNGHVPQVHTSNNGSNHVHGSRNNSHNAPPVPSHRETATSSSSCLVNAAANATSTMARSSAVRRQQQCHGHSNNHDPEIRQAISESQAAHIAHTRRQVTHDIQFRRSLELALDESRRSIHRGGSGDPQGTLSPGEQVEEPDIEELIRLASRRSILDEQNHELEAEKKYALEFESALKQSKNLTAIKQEEEARFMQSEEEMIQDAIVKSRTEEEKALRHEEELLRRALVKSLAEEANVNEDVLVEEVMMRSLSESEHRALSEREHWVDGEDGDEDPEDMIKKALKLSLEEKKQIADEEEGQLTNAIEWSVLEEACNSYDHQQNAVDESSVP